MNIMNQQLMKRNHLNEAIAVAAVKYWNANCKTCKHFQKYTHPLQELHYQNGPVGECKKIKMLVYDINPSPKCGGLLYEEK